MKLLIRPLQNSNCSRKNRRSSQSLTGLHLTSATDQGSRAGFTGRRTDCVGHVESRIHIPVDRQPDIHFTAFVINDTYDRISGASNRYIGRRSRRRICRKITQRIYRIEIALTIVTQLDTNPLRQITGTGVHRQHHRIRHYLGMVQIGKQVSVAHLILEQLIFLKGSVRVGDLVDIKSKIALRSPTRNCGGNCVSCSSRRNDDHISIPIELQLLTKGSQTSAIIDKPDNFAIVVLKITKTGQLTIIIGNFHVPNRDVIRLHRVSYGNDISGRIHRNEQGFRKEGISRWNLNSCSIRNSHPGRRNRLCFARCIEKREV